MRPPHMCTPRSTVVVSIDAPDEPAQDMVLEIETPAGPPRRTEVHTSAANLDPDPMLGYRDNVAATQKAVKLYVDALALSTEASNSELNAAVLALQEAMLVVNQTLETQGSSIADLAAGLQSQVDALAALAAATAAADAGLGSDIQDLQTALVAVGQTLLAQASDISDLESALQAQDSTLQSHGTAIQSQGSAIETLEQKMVSDDPALDTFQEIVNRLKSIAGGSFSISTTPPTDTSIPWFDSSDGVWSVYLTDPGVWVSTSVGRLVYAG